MKFRNLNVFYKNLLHDKIIDSQESFDLFGGHWLQCKIKNDIKERGEYEDEFYVIRNAS